MIFRREVFHPYVLILDAKYRVSTNHLLKIMDCPYPINFVFTGFAVRAVDE